MGAFGAGTLALGATWVQVAAASPTSPFVPWLLAGTLVLAALFCATIVGVAMSSIRQARYRRSLIQFPENWTARRRCRDNTFQVIVSVDVFWPYDVVEYHYTVRANGIPVVMTASRRQHFLRPERTVIELTGDLASLPADARQAEVDLEVVLDGRTKKSSGPRLVPITL